MGTRYEGSDQEIRALNALIALSRATESIHATLAGYLGRHELTTGQFGVMEVLYFLGPQSQVQLGRKLLRTAGNVTVVVDNLERRGLITKSRSKEDRRRYDVRLTEVGRKKIERLFPDHARNIAALFSILSPEQQEKLTELCRALGLHAAGNG